VNWLCKPTYLNATVQLYTVSNDNLYLPINICILDIDFELYSDTDKDLYSI